MKKSLFLLFVFVSLFAGDRFVRDDVKEIVTDNFSHLMWQDNSDAKSIKMSWDDSVKYCHNLTLGGYDDWRLANFNELFALADRSKNAPAISMVFINIMLGDYWTSTTFADDTSKAWAVLFYNGDDFLMDKTKSLYVRCVRDTN